MMPSSLQPQRLHSTQQTIQVHSSIISKMYCGAPGINKVIPQLSACQLYFLTKCRCQKEKWEKDVQKLFGHLHQLLQAGEVDAVYAIHTWRADVLLDVSSVHKRQVDLFCHVGCCEDHDVGMSETRGQKMTRNKQTNGNISLMDVFLKSQISESRSVKHGQWCHWHVYKTAVHPDRLIWSSWVRTELTTRMASEGSVPAWQAFLAAVRLST